MKHLIIDSCYGKNEICPFNEEFYCKKTFKNIKDIGYCKIPDICPISDNFFTNIVSEKLKNIEISLYPAIIQLGICGVEREYPDLFILKKFENVNKKIEETPIEEKKEIKKLKGISIGDSI